MTLRQLCGAPFWLVAHTFGLVAVAIGGFAIVTMGVAAIIDGDVD